MSRFINERKNNWQRLEDLLSMLQGNSIRGLSRAEVREFGELYRRAATDLAIARAETRDPKLLNYLNSLVIRAHGKIYRAENQGFGLIWQFFTKDFPQAFRRTWKFTFLAFALMLVFGTASFLLCYYDTNFADSQPGNDSRPLHHGHPLRRESSVRLRYRGTFNSGWCACGSQLCQKHHRGAGWQHST